MANQARYQQIAALLRGRIVAGDLRVGARLPVVRALAAHFAVPESKVKLSRGAASRLKRFSIG